MISKVELFLMDGRCPSGSVCSVRIFRSLVLLLFALLIASCSKTDTRWKAIGLDCSFYLPFDECEITWSNGQNIEVTKLGNAGTYEPKGKLVGSDYWAEAEMSGCLKLWENGAVKDCSYSKPVGSWEQSGYPEGWYGPGSPSSTVITNTSPTVINQPSTSTTAYIPYSLILNDFRWGDFEVPIDPIYEKYVFRFLLSGRERNPFRLKVFVNGAPVVASIENPRNTNFSGFVVENNIQGCETDACLSNGDFAQWVYIPVIDEFPKPEVKYKVYAEIYNANSMKSKSQVIELIYSSTDGNGQEWGYGAYRWRWINKL